jgi:Cupredoxin-like domain
VSRKKRAIVSRFAMLATLALGPIGRAEEEALPVLRFHDGTFEPGELVVKAKAPFRLRVVNETQEAIEFESFELNRERVVLPGAEIVVYLPALDPGSYKFFDDFHQGAGEGTITAK